MRRPRQLLPPASPLPPPFGGVSGGPAARPWPRAPAHGLPRAPRLGMAWHVTWPEWGWESMAGAGGRLVLVRSSSAPLLSLLTSLCSPRLPSSISLPELRQQSSCGAIEGRELLHGHLDSVIMPTRP